MLFFADPICSGKRSGWGGSRGSVERWGRDPSRQIGLVCSWFAVYWTILGFISTRSCNVSETSAASVPLFCNEYKWSSEILNMVPKHFSENNPRRTCLFLGCLFPNLYWIVLILAMLDITNYMRSLQSLFIGSGDLSLCCNMDFACYQKMAHSLLWLFVWSIFRPNYNSNVDPF